jgi:hypothetical protein
VSTYGNVEIDHEYGGTWTLTPGNDLQLAIDAIDDARATRQRITRLINTTPILYDDNGSPIARPDDISNPTWGAGARMMVGRNIDQKLLSDLRARVVAGISDDSGIARTPAPTVTVADLGGGMLSVAVSCYTIAGQSVNVPVTLNVYGA